MFRRNSFFTPSDEEMEHLEGLREQALAPPQPVQMPDLPAHITPEQLQHVASLLEGNEYDEAARFVGTLIEEYGA